MASQPTKEEIEQAAALKAVEDEAKAQAKAEADALLAAELAAKAVADADAARVRAEKLRLAKEAAASKLLEERAGVLPGQKYKRIYELPNGTLCVDW